MSFAAVIARGSREVRAGLGGGVECRCGAAEHSEVINRPAERIYLFFQRTRVVRVALELACFGMEYLGGGGRG